MKQRRLTGISIIEVCLVMTLLSLLMSLVAMYFVRARHLTSDTETYSRVQSQANLGLRRMTDALYSGSSSYSQYFGDSIIFLSSSPPGSTGGKPEFNPVDGSIVWKKWVCFYHDPASRTIMKGELPLTPPTSNLLSAPEPSVGPTLFRTDGAVRRVAIAREIEDFTVSGTGETFRISVTCRSFSPVPRKNDEEKAVEVSVSTEVFLLN